jgi:Ankyrin repeats (3 copies)
VIYRSSAFSLILIAASCSTYRESRLAGAARRGDAEGVVELIRRGASTEEGSGVNSWTPLMHAINKNQAVAAFALIDHGANPNFTNGDTTPLMLAAGYGQEKMVRGLLKRGADPRRMNVKGENALDLALSGVHDIDAWTAGKCQTGTVAALIAYAPGLAHSGGFAEKTARFVKACPELRALLSAL